MATEAVRFYQDRDQNGAFIDLPLGRYNRISGWGIGGTFGTPNGGGTTTWDNQVSGFEIPPGWLLRLYEDEGFAGYMRTAQADEAWVGDADNDKVSSFELRDPIQPLASRRELHVIHGEAIRKATAFFHISGSIALGIFGLSGVANIIGKAESDAGLLYSGAGGDDSKNFELKDNALRTGQDERLDPGPGVYAYQQVYYGGDFVRLGPGVAADLSFNVIPGAEGLGLKPGGIGTAGIDVAQAHVPKGNGPLSLGIYPGLRVVAFDGPGLTGNSITFAGSQPELGAWAGRIKSLRVEVADADVANAEIAYVLALQQGDKAAAPPAQVPPASPPASAPAQPAAGTAQAGSAAPASAPPTAPTAPAASSAGVIVLGVGLVAVLGAGAYLMLRRRRRRRST